MWSCPRAASNWIPAKYHCESSRESRGWTDLRVGGTVHTPLKCLNSPPPDFPGTAHTLSSGSSHSLSQWPCSWYPGVR